MNPLLLTGIENALRSIYTWRGWTTKDRHLIHTLAANVHYLAEQYQTRETALKKADGSPHVHRR